MQRFLNIYFVEMVILESMRVVTFKLEDELLRELDLYAINKRLSRSEVIRLALLKYLKDDGKLVR